MDLSHGFVFHSKTKSRKYSISVSFLPFLFSLTNGENVHMNAQVPGWVVDKRSSFSICFLPLDYKTCYNIQKERKKEMKVLLDLS